MALRDMNVATCSLCAAKWKYGLDPMHECPKAYVAGHAHFVVQWEQHNDDYCLNCGRVKGVGCACGLSFELKAKTIRVDRESLR